MDDNLQIDNGHYTRIHNRILEELAKIELSGYETRIILAIWRKTYGWQKKEEWITQKQFSELTNLPKSEVSRTLSRLKRRNLVVETYNSHQRTYCFNKHFTNWKGLEKSTTSCRNLHKGGVEIYNSKPLKSTTRKHMPSPKETLTKEKKRKIKEREKEFDIFYSFYPIHQGRKKAFEKWNKKVGDNELPLLEILLTAIEENKDSEKWQGEQGKYIPHPATWLHNELWNDEIKKTKQWS